MRVRACVVAACLSAVSLAPVPASAQGKPGGAKGTEESQKDKAKAFIKSGNRAAAGGKWDDAYADFSIAWAMHKDWETALGLGKAAYKTEHHAEAFERLSFYLREAPPKKVTPKQRTEVEGMIADAKSKTSTLDIVAPEGREVLVDRTSVGKTPLPAPIRVDPGKHEIEVRHGTSGQTKTVEAAAGASVDVKFEPPKPPPAPTAAPVEKPPPTSPVRTIGLVTGGVLAAGGLAVGGAFLGLSFAADGDIEKAQGAYDREAAKKAVESKDIALNTALWGFVGAGVAVAGTVVFYFVTRPSKAAPPLKGKLSVTPGGPAILIEGQF